MTRGKQSFIQGLCSAKKAEPTKKAAPAKKAEPAKKAPEEPSTKKVKKVKGTPLFKKD